MSKATSLPIALLLCGAGLLAVASGAVAQGDGSDTDNAGLLRGTIAAGCRPGMLCDYAPEPRRPAAAEPVVIAAPPASPVVESQSAVLPSLYHSPPQPDLTPAWDNTFGVSLRGSYVVSGDRRRYEAQIIPRFALDYEGRGARAGIGGELRLVQSSGGDARIGGAALDIAAGYRLRRDTAIEAGASLSFTQDDPDALSQQLDTVAVAPVEWTGAANAAVARRFGQFDARVSGEISRSETSETELTGGGTVNNSADNFTRYEGGLRLGYALTPVTSLFISSSASRDVFDTASPVTGISRTGWRYDLRAGASANWQDVTGLDVSVGRAWRRFDDPAISEAEAMVYGAALTFDPNRTTALRASFDTALTPGSNAPAASIDYTLALEARYKINTLVTLRGSASASWTDPADGSPSERRYSAGAGADLVLGKRSAMTLDYDYGWRDDPSATTPERSEHRVSAGVTLQY